MRDVMSVTKALADEKRTRAVMFLRGREMCVCQVVEMLGLAPSTVSKHLDILNQAGLIESRKAGRWVYYRLPDTPSASVKKVLAWLECSLAEDPQILRDAKRLPAVMGMDKEKLCCRYRS